MLGITILARNVMTFKVNAELIFLQLDTWFPWTGITLKPHQWHVIVVIWCH